MIYMSILQRRVLGSLGSIAMNQLEPGQLYLQALELASNNSDEATCQYPDPQVLS